MSASPEFVVELPIFSGPFRLLADLILDRSVDVCDVPVARLTDAFVHAGGREMASWSIEDSTWFLAMCAVLLELKVGRLLPRHVVESEEDLLGGSSPDLLYARSLELSAFRHAADDLARRMADAALLSPRTAGPPPELAHLYPDVMERITVEDLRRVAEVLFKPEPEVDLSHVTPIRASLADALDTLRAHFSTTPEARFRDLVDGCQERIDVVVRFLAVLELYRQGHVELSQAGVFGDIEVRWHGGTGPTAGEDDIEEYG